MRLLSASKVGKRLTWQTRNRRFGCRQYCSKNNGTGTGSGSGSKVSSSETGAKSRLASNTKTAPQTGTKPGTGSGATTTTTTAKAKSKKPFPIKLFLTGSSALIILGYTAAVVHSQEDEKFRQKFAKFAPGADIILNTLLDPVEVKKTVEHLKQDFEQAQTKVKSTVDEKLKETEKEIQAFVTDIVSDNSTDDFENTKDGEDGAFITLPVSDDDEVVKIIEELDAEEKEKDNEKQEFTESESKVEQTEAVIEDVVSAAEQMSVLTEIKDNIEHVIEEESNIQNTKIETLPDNEVEVKTEVDSEETNLDIQTEEKEVSDESTVDTQQTEEKEIKDDVTLEVSLENQNQGQMEEMVIEGDAHDVIVIEDDNAIVIEDVTNDVIINSTENTSEIVENDDSNGLDEIDTDTNPVLQDEESGGLEEEISLDDLTLEEAKIKISALMGRMVVLEVDHENLLAKLENERKQNNENLENALDDMETTWKNKIEETHAKHKDDMEMETVLLNLKHQEDLANVQKKLDELYKFYYDDQVKAQRDDVWKAADAHFSQKLGIERAQRLRNLEILRQRAFDIENSLKQHCEISRENLKRQAKEIVITHIADCTQTGKKISISKKTVEGLYENSSPIAKLAIENIPDELFESGISTRSSLINTFPSMKKEIRIASLLPDDGGGLGSYYYAKFWSSLTFERHQGTVPKDEESKATTTDRILGKAEYYLSKGMLFDATVEINQLDGWPRVVAKEWLKNSRTHLETQQALTLLKCEI